MLEKEIEKKVCDYAKSKGWYVRKFTSPNCRSVPDRMLINPKGKIIFIEFKRAGEKSTVGQVREQNRLIDHGQDVVVIDDVESGKKEIDDWQDVRAGWGYY